MRAGKPELIRDFIEAYTMMKEMEHDREELEKSDQAKKKAEEVELHDNTVKFLEEMQMEEATSS